LDVDEEIVEKSKFMGMHIIQKAQPKNITTGLLKCIILSRVHHCGDGDTFLTDEPLGESQDILIKFQGLFGRPTYANP
jgi:hypothetical protein